MNRDKCILDICHYHLITEVNYNKYQDIVKLVDKPNKTNRETYFINLVGYLREYGTNTCLFIKNKDVYEAYQPVHKTEPLFYKHSILYVYDEIVQLLNLKSDNHLIKLESNDIKNKVKILNNIYNIIIYDDENNVEIYQKGTLFPSIELDPIKMIVVEERLKNFKQHFKNYLNYLLNITPTEIKLVCNFDNKRGLQWNKTMHNVNKQAIKYVKTHKAKQYVPDIHYICSLLNFLENVAGQYYFISRLNKATFDLISNKTFIPEIAEKIIKLDIELNGIDTYFSSNELAKYLGHLKIIKYKISNAGHTLLYNPDINMSSQETDFNTRLRKLPLHLLE